MNGMWSSSRPQGWPRHGFQKRAGAIFFGVIATFAAWFFACSSIGFFFRFHSAGFQSEYVCVVAAHAIGRNQTHRRRIRAAGIVFGNRWVTGYTPGTATPSASSNYGTTGAGRNQLQRGDVRCGGEPAADGGHHAAV